MSLQPEFPAPIRFGGRLRFDQHEHENYKRALAGLPAVARGEAEPIRFVDASAVCADLAIDRRTLGRRVRGRIRQRLPIPTTSLISAAR
jgi:hypothetical protein